METTNPSNPIKPNSLCDRCRYKLIHKAKYKKTDPWMALEITSLLVLVRKTLDDKRFLIKYGNDPHSISKVPCLGCFLPDTLNTIIEVAKGKDLTKVKELADE